MTWQDIVIVLLPSCLSFSCWTLGSSCQSQMISLKRRRSLATCGGSWLLERWLAASLGPVRRLWNGSKSSDRSGGLIKRKVQPLVSKPRWTESVPFRFWTSGPRVQGVQGQRAAHVAEHGERRWSAVAVEGQRDECFENCPWNRSEVCSLWAGKDSFESLLKLTVEPLLWSSCLFLKL